MESRYKFNRMEFSGSLGDLGTLLPIAMGIIMICGLSPLGIFFTIGLFYILTGFYYGVTVPIQPMKVIGAYAIATGIEATQISASALLIGVFLLIIGGTGAIRFIGKYIPPAVVRGVQLSTGILLMTGSIKFIIGDSKYQAFQRLAEPYLSIQSLGPIPIGIFLGIAGSILTLALLGNKKFPAGLTIIISGLIIGLLLGTHEGFDKLKPGFHLPQLLPYGLPSGIDFSTAILLLVLPQIPMTVGNAVIAYSDLSQEYFEDKSKKVTYISVCISMGLANLFSFLLGGIPLCHGAGGLAAHYRFGARTAGSNIIIGGIFIILAIFLGDKILSILYLLPMSILGVLLLFAGSQLALTLIDVKERNDLFVVLLMLTLTLTLNLGVGFFVGISVSYLLKLYKISL